MSSGARLPSFAISLTLDEILPCASLSPIKRGNTSAYLRVVVRIKWESTCMHQAQSKHLIMLVASINNKYICAHLWINFVILFIHDVQESFINLNWYAEETQVFRRTVQILILLLLKSRDLLFQQLYVKHRLVLGC